MSWLTMWSVINARSIESCYVKDKEYAVKKLLNIYFAEPSLFYVLLHVLDWCET